MSEAPAEWEKYKFETQAKLKEQEVRISQRRLTNESRRNILIGMLVPIVVALMTAVPVYINSINQHSLQQATFEANLIIESVKTGDPHQAVTNLLFIIDAGLLSDKTAERVRGQLVHSAPGVGRALPAD